MIESGSIEEDEVAELLKLGAIGDMNTAFLTRKGI